MNKTEARTCYGCKAICSLRKGGCAFGFPVKTEIQAGTVTQIKTRRPVKPCFKVTNNAQFNRVAEYMEQTP